MARLYSRIALAALIYAVGSASAAAQPSEVWVDDDWFGCGPGEIVDGHVCGNDAFASIQDGIDVVVSPGKVNVASGIYRENINLKGGITLSGEGAEATIVDGQSNGSVISARNFALGSAISGFTITNGSGTPVGGYTYGGAIFAENVTLTVSNSTLSGNFSSDGAGGVEARDSLVSLYGNRIIDNGGWWGGGITFYRTEGTVAGNIIERNNCGYGGAVWLSEESVVILANNQVTRNGCSPPAIGIGRAAEVTIVNNTVADNNGSGIATGVYYTGMESGFADIYNCIIWGNPETLVNLSAMYTDTDGNDLGKGNMSLPPRFEDPQRGDYRLSTSSPAIDTGTVTGMPQTDLLGRSRNQGPAVDLGAYETTPAMALVELSNLPADVGFMRWLAAADTLVGGTADLIGGAVQEPVTFLRDSPRKLAELDDVTMNGSPELVVVGVQPNGRPRVQVRDGSSGAVIQDQVFFWEAFYPLDMVVIGGLANDSADDVAVLGEQASSGQIVVQTRDGASGSLVSNVYFMDPSWTAMQLLDLGETDSNPGADIGVVTVSQAGDIKIPVKDAASGSPVRTLRLLNPNWDPIQAIVIPDYSGNGAVEVGLLATNRMSGKPVIQIRDGASNVLLTNVFPFNKDWRPIKAVVLPDDNGNGAAELAILAVKIETGRLLIQVRDSRTGQYLRNLTPLGARWEPQDMIAITDVGDDTTALSVLAIRWPDDVPIIQTVNALTGDLISNVYLK